MGDSIIHGSLDDQRLSIPSSRGDKSRAEATALLTSVGVTALLAASHAAYEALRLAGAVYLLGMGARLLWSTRRKSEDAPDPEQAVEPSGRSGFFGGWRRGALTNLLNPKVGVFYVALLPQFIPNSVPHMAWGVLLTCVHIGLGLMWSSLVIVLALRMRHLLQRPRARRLLDRVTGTVIAGFGVRLAMGE